MHNPIMQAKLEIREAQYRDNVEYAKSLLLQIEETEAILANLRGRLSELEALSGKNNSQPKPR